jgi:N-acetylmuramic acid 6-phosphate etherase
MKNKEYDIISNPPSGARDSIQKITEQNSLHDNLDKKSVLDLLSGMNEEDRKVPIAVAKAIPQIEDLVKKIVERMKKGGRIFYLGAGTSGRLGVLDASEIPPTFGMPSHLVVGLIAGGEKALRNPVENAEDDTEKGWQELTGHNVNINDTVIGIAASGTTPYVVGALKNARINGILTASISCNPDSPVANEAEIKIEVVVGPEFVTGSTRLKSGTAQKLVLNMITTVTMIKLGRVKGNKMVNMQLSNQKLVDRGIRMIVDELGIGYDQAKNILLIHGSVKKAIDEFKVQNPNK